MYFLCDITHACLTIGISLTYAGINLAFGLPISLLHVVGDPYLFLNFQQVIADHVAMFETRYFNQELFTTLQATLFLISAGDIQHSLCGVLLKLSPVPVFITSFAGPEKAPITGLVVNDGHYSDGAFIKNNYYSLDALQRKLRATQDLNEEFCIQAQSILQQLKCRRPIQINEHSNFLSSQENKESMQYRTITGRMYNIAGQLDYEGFHNEISHYENERFHNERSRYERFHLERQALAPVMRDYFMISPTASNEEYTFSSPDYSKRRQLLQTLRWEIWNQDRYLRYLHRTDDFQGVQSGIKKIFKQMESRC